MGELQSYDHTPLPLHLKAIEKMNLSFEPKENILQWEGSPSIMSSM